jgi:cysteinyl-tRNA synthetase
MNTLTQRLEEFRPLDPPRVRLYSCGPTVYQHVHVGNMRAYLFADILRRVLEYNGWDVTQVRNITDVGHLTDDTLSTGADKIEAMARRENVTPQDIAEHYTRLFHRDADRLNLLRPHQEPRATEYVGPMIELVQHLIERGYAYQSGENVYFEVARFPSYGALSGNSVEDLIAGARVEVGEGKRAPADFNLWRAAGPEKLMRFESPWGMGVPGWHIECSAMSMKLLGEQLDIHTGGVDNIFPHHEDERAQSEAATGKPFVRYWLHNAWLVLAGDEKMSKSLGNFYTVQDLVDLGIHPLAFRYFNFQAHYRTPLTFSIPALEAAQTSLHRVWEQVAELLQFGPPEALNEEARGLEERFHASINRDLDLSGAVAVLHEALGSKLPAGQKLALVDGFDSVFGLDLVCTGKRLSEVTALQRRLLDQRAEARAHKDWAASDRLREALAAIGLEVKDTPRGQRWVRRDLLSALGRELQDAAEQQTK